MPDWAKEFNSAVTVCNTNGIILYMNKKAGKTFEKWGGIELIGKSLFDCHNDHSVAKIKELIATEKSNSYTIEKNGVKKLIHQAPWFKDGKCAGLVEISIEIPFDMSHFVR
ncbi:MAG: PAS domain-containing protein [Bacteroidota bacterium]